MQAIVTLRQPANAGVRNDSAAARTMSIQLGQVLSNRDQPHLQGQKSSSLQHQFKVQHERSLFKPLIGNAHSFCLAYKRTMTAGTKVTRVAGPASTRQGNNERVLRLSSEYLLWTLPYSVVAE